MKTWQKIVLITLGMALVVGIRIYFIQRERNAPMAVKPQAPERKLTADDLVTPRKLYIDNVESAKALNGKTVWVQSGYALDYYPYAGHRVDFAHQAGVLPSIEPLAIKDIITQKAPANLAMRVPLGDKQVFAVFTMPNDAKDYATAIGFIKGADSTYFCDQIFYYDDPHQMYHFWPANIWAGVDAHQAVVGMNELQAAMALGVLQQSQSSDIGNRTVDYEAGPKKWTVTFQKDKATSVKQD
jgi:hypothetical protein